MRILSIVILAILCCSAFSCKTDRKPTVPKKAKHIFAKYYVRYLQTEKELKAEVSIKEGDVLAQARSIALTEVTFEKNTMNPQNLGKSYGLRYSFRKKGPYRESYEFNYSSEHIGQQSQTVSMSPLTNFLIKEGHISKTDGMTLVWEGKPLTADQEMILLFTDEQKKATPIQITGPTERSELFFSSEKLSGLSLGKGKLMLIKKQFKTLEKNNYTTISEMEFYSNNLDIEVK